MKIKFLVLIVFFTMNCTNSINKETRELFSEWRQDTLGCYGKRNVIYEENYRLIQRKLIGLSNNSLTYFLGKPNEVTKENELELLQYYISEGIQCIDSTERYIDALRLAFVSRNNIVIELREVIP